MINPGTQKLENFCVCVMPTTVDVWCYRRLNPRKLHEKQVATPSLYSLQGNDMHKYSLAPRSTKRSKFNQV